MSGIRHVTRFGRLMTRRRSLLLLVLIGGAAWALRGPLFTEDLLDLFDARLSQRDVLPGGDFLQDAFAESVFGERYAHPIAGGKRLWRWHGELNVALVGQVSEEIRKRVSERVEVFARLAGLSASVALGLDGSESLIMHFVEPSELPPTAYAMGVSKNYAWHLEDAVCLAGFLARPGYHGAKGYNIITSDGGKRRVDRCIDHELSHSLGLVDHIRSIPSVLNVQGFPERFLTTGDKILLRVLYDPRLRPGISREEALSIARIIIDELVAAYRAHGEAALTHPRHRPASAGR